MGGLTLLAAAALVTLGFYRWRRPSPRPPARDWLMFVALYSLTLLLALRFGARTYPGFWHPESRFLNRWLNGTALFTEIGYDAVGLAALTAVLPALLPGSKRCRSVAFAASWATAALLALAAAISIYGFVWACRLGRLPH